MPHNMVLYLDEHSKQLKLHMDLFLKFFKQITTLVSLILASIFPSKLNCPKQSYDEELFGLFCMQRYQCSMYLLSID